MTINPIMKIIRAKKLGLLMRDARLRAGKSPEECAQSMGVSCDELTAMEFGERPPTLPELELYAYHLGIPLEHFWGKDLLPEDWADKELDPAEITRIRQESIGALIQRSRGEASLSLEELAARTGIAVDVLQNYEQGAAPVPIPELESLAQGLDQSFESFEDQQGPVGSWSNEQQIFRQFRDLPQELQEFICRPINRPYLEIAVRLSELNVDKLRALGEGLLEITL